MTREEAIEAIKYNWPDSRYTILREALDMAVKALEDVTDKNVEKMTNADRIRSMSNEELAKLLCCTGWRMIEQKECLEWLQQPGKENDYENQNYNYDGK